MRTAGIIVATDDEQDFQPEYPSVLHMLGNGKTILDYQISRLAAFQPDDLLIMGYPGKLPQIANYCYRTHPDLKIITEPMRTERSNDVPTVAAAFYRGLYRASWRFDSTHFIFFVPNLVGNGLGFMSDVDVDVTVSTKITSLGKAIGLLGPIGQIYRDRLKFPGPKFLSEIRTTGQAELQGMPSQITMLKDLRLLGNID